MRKQKIISRKSKIYNSFIKKNIKIITACFLFILTCLIVNISSCKNVLDPNNSSTTDLQNTAGTLATKNSENKIRKAELEKNINSIIASYPEVDTSVSLKDLYFDVTQSYGNTKSYTAASTTKIITAIYYLSLVEENKRALEQIIGDYTAKWQIQQMINQSNNNSWYLLNNNLGYSNLEDYAHSIGLTSFDSLENTITATEENLLLQKLYNGELLSNYNKKLLLSYMQNTNYETLIPEALPDNAIVYHKYGLLDNNLHDNSIIIYKGNVVFLTIMTDSINTVDYTERTELFHEIVSAVLKFEQIDS